MKPQTVPIIPDYLRGLTPMHTDAYARFLSTGLPAPKVEAYKYTNVAQAVDFRSAVSAATLTPTLAGSTQYVRMEKYVANANAAGSLGLLNAAFAAETVVVDIPAGTKLSEPIYLTWHARHHELVCPRVVINIGAEAAATVIEAQSGQNTGWCNRVCDIQVGEGAVLKHYHTLGGAGVYTHGSHVNVADNGYYETLLLNAGGQTTRRDVTINLNGQGARATLKCANLLKGTQHGDLTAKINHMAPHTASNQTIRSVLMDNACGVYQGKIYVDRIAQKTDGYQLSNALLLSPTAEMDTRPELEIYADDVKCSHGATTGALDETQLFYLQSRGLPEAQARALLLKGFVTSLFDNVDENLRGRFEGIIEGWLL